MTKSRLLNVATLQRLQLRYSYVRRNLRILKEVHGKLDFLHNMLQRSMDGPNVNWKMIDLIKEEKREFDSEKPALLNIGSGGPHVWHGAYKTALSTTDRKLDKFLKDCYSVF